MHNMMAVGVFNSLIMIFKYKHFFCKKRSHEKVLEILKKNLIKFVVSKTHDFECFEMK